MHLFEVVAGELDARRGFGVVGVGGVCWVDGPVEAEPLDVADDGIDVFLVFFCWVCVVEAEVAAAVVLGCDCEVERDGFGVSDVEVAVGFWWEACGDNCGVAGGSPFSGLDVFVDDLVDEVGLWCFWCGHVMLLAWLFGGIGAEW